MKNYSIITLSFLIFAGFACHSVSAQFPIKIPKLPKIEKSKKEQIRNEDKGNSNNENINQNASTSSEPAKLLEVKSSSVGKMYFSNKPFGATNESGKTSFTTGDYVYGRLETGGKTLREAFGFAPISKENPEHKLDFLVYVYSASNDSVDGYRTDLSPASNYGLVSFTEADLDKTYWNFDVLPDPSKTTTRMYDSGSIRVEAEEGGAQALYKFLKVHGEEKTYTVAIELVKKTTDFRGNQEPKEKWMAVEGRLMLDFKGADFAKIKADQEKMQADRIARIRKGVEDSKQAKLENETLPKEWTLKSNPLLPGLTESNLRALYQQYGAHYTPKQIIKFYAAPYASTGRKVVTNDLGIPVHRILDQWFTVFAKVKFKDGEESCFYQNFLAAEKYAGGGTYGNLILITQTRTDISCAKLGVK